VNIYFDHICGQQQDSDFLHMLVSATFEESEHQYALDNGWSPSNIWYSQNTNFKKLNSTIWYQSRQSRINLEKYQETARERKVRKKAKNTAYKIVKFDFSKMYSIYAKYMYAKNFGDMLDSKAFAESYDQDNLIFIMYGEVAVSILEIVGDSLIAHQFIWDYAESGLGLGTYATYIEIELAKTLGLKYLYLGPSYENSALYKANYSGFEFWTGRRWSDESEVYKQLLAKDEELDTIKKINNYYKNYLESLSV
jgi:arginyl-tRNA--protein-N-Asp/Glu arginylyltransferase